MLYSRLICSVGRHITIPLSSSSTHLGRDWLPVSTTCLLVHLCTWSFQPFFLATVVFPCLFEAQLFCLHCLSGDRQQSSKCNVAAVIRDLLSSMGMLCKALYVQCRVMHTCKDRPDLCKPACHHAVILSKTLNKSRIVKQ